MGWCSSDGETVVASGKESSRKEVSDAKESSSQLLLLL